ncbi:hypothetical protein BZG02_11780 [Labilibaculum filiforme]|uniref:Secretion system C-terminal sorting domain-containing protein n=1 Tax=Labilibaculum filiforme TaxID=1940526 RepID=A0A2N3HXW1_9BACT|nr:hypothetical protein [Labilibaculum filiforme]PKQ62867.1 hypothetical protein BZG02_11780 [Labilibaculum filiforme]
MKNKITLLLFLFLFNFAYADKLELSGIFLGKNIYILNPFSDSGVGFCVSEITVNGQTSEDEINSSAFEIDLSKFNFPIGEKINITITYKNGCLPRIINPEAIKPISSFNLQNATIDKKGILNWTTKDEMGALPFIIQQYRWNKWITIGEVEGVGIPQLNKYQLNVRPHSGKNIFRIYQVDYTKKPNYTSEINYVSALPAITFGPEKVKDELLFTNETLCEIYDNYGNIVFKGFGNKIRLEELQDGLYYINYDNTMGSFRKK